MPAQTVPTCRRPRPVAPTAEPRGRPGLEAYRAGLAFTIVCGCDRRGCGLAAVARKCGGYLLASEGSGYAAAPFGKRASRAQQWSGLRPRSFSPLVAWGPLPARDRCALRFAPPLHGASRPPAPPGEPGTSFGGPRSDGGEKAPPSVEPPRSGGTEERGAGRTDRGSPAGANDRPGSTRPPPPGRTSPR